jgi:hypothetical protein
VIALSDGVPRTESACNVIVVAARTYQQDLHLHQADCHVDILKSETAHRKDPTCLFIFHRYIHTVRAEQCDECAWNMLCNRYDARKGRFSRRQAFRVDVTLGFVVKQCFVTTT